MEAQVRDANQLTAGVLLPPRKRILTGLKKQNYKTDSNMPVLRMDLPPPATLGVFDARLNHVLNSHGNISNLSPEEVAEVSSTAAMAAAQAARAARALAEEKAAIAGKAMAEAKSALDLVAYFSKESGGSDRYLKRNKPKKHVPLNSLYGKRKSVENWRADEELARRLHRAMNSSGRKVKHS